MWKFLIMTAAGITTLCSAAAGSELSRRDILWLDRIAYGPTTATADQYLKLGQRRFLDEQLHPRNPQLPPAVAGQISALEISRSGSAELLAYVTSEQQRINSLSDEATKQAERKTLNDKGNRLAYEAARRELLRALYSPAQLQEQVVWFWLNHLSVFQYKANDPWLIGDYAEHAIRPHALGHFRDLVMATLTHPAMLQYLDNAQNAAGHINENYARELMELHTLGVDSGYTQQDIQELAKVLTGAGINASGNTPKLKPEWQRLYRRDGAFEFNPARHDFGAKMLLGHRIEGSGFGEVEQALDLLVSQPACAQFVSRWYRNSAARFERTATEARTTDTDPSTGYSEAASTVDRSPASRHGWSEQRCFRIETTRCSMNIERCWEDCSAPSGASRRINWSEYFRSLRQLISNSCKRES
jgi:hypothetical protein